MIRKTIREMDFIPRFYGVAYFRYDRCETVCYPIPLNIIVGFVRKVYFIIKHGIKPHQLDDAKFKATKVLQDLAEWRERALDAEKRLEKEKEDYRALMAFVRHPERFLKVPGKKETEEP